MGQAIVMQNLADGEVVSWKFTTPDSSTVFLFSLTYNQASDCFIASNGYSYCGYGDAIGFNAWGSINSCQQTWSHQETGLWSINTYDNDTLLYSNPFSVSRNAASFLGVTSPTDNQLFQLLQGNYNATGPVQFSAGTNTGQPINWTVPLHYQSSGGYPNPATDPTPLAFQGNTYSYPGYQSIGGKGQATATTTASDGSTVQDCVTFYVEGPEAGILNTTITSRLYSLYATGATPNLMTGIAMKESSYSQFRTPLETNPDLFSLYANFQIAAKWPFESPGNGGRYIGLMQVPTTDPIAWDWFQNTNDAVNSTDHGFVAMKLPLANTWMNWIISENNKKNIPAHPGLPSFLSPSVQMENLALVLYGPKASSLWTQQYYIPVCPSPGVITVKGNTWTCKGGSWYWAIDDPAIDPNVTPSNIGPGVTVFGNPDGVNYANTVRSLMQ